MDNLSKRERAFYATAKDISMLSNHRARLGCIVVDKHRIISSGCNSKTKCHPLQIELDNQFFPGYENKGPIHAETAALLPLIRRRVDLTGATLYLYREDRNGNLAPSRPCARCMTLIRELGIKQIKYTTSDGFATEKIIKNFG